MRIRKSFPDNTSTAFKARLPQALNFKDEASEVALSNLCLPDDGFTTNWLLNSEDFGSDFPIRQKLTTIFHQTFWKEVVVPNGMQWRLDEAIAWLDNPEDHVIRNGTELVAFLLDQIIQSIALNTKMGENYFFEDSQFSVSQFIWTSAGLKVLQLKDKGNNGKAAHVRFAVNAEFAKGMGWFIENRDGSFSLGPNLEILNQVYPVPQGHEKKWQMIMKRHMGVNVNSLPSPPFARGNSKTWVRLFTVTLVAPPNLWWFIRMW